MCETLSSLASATVGVLYHGNWQRLKPKRFSLSGTEETDYPVFTSMPLERAWIMQDSSGESKRMALDLSGLILHICG